MALTLEQQTALANERRYQELKVKEGSVLGQLSALANIKAAFASNEQAVMAALGPIRAEITVLEQGAGPGLSNDFGPYSTLEQAMRAERFAGKAATIDFIKANPECSEADAVAAYQSAALAARPADRQYLIQDASGLLKEYAAGSLALGLIADTTWESFRALVVATPAEQLMGL